MTKHFNKKEIQKRRRFLRSNMTFSEKLVWMFLRKHQMNDRFLRQYSVDNYVIDFYCPKLKLAIEIDGDVHDLKRQKMHDKTRQEYLEQLGIKFLRIKNEDLLNNPNKAFERIENKIKEEPLPAGNRRYSPLKKRGEKSFNN
jgi:very-short-patch-repair endonuclease